MITANWEKLGLTGCDIQEYESNKNCEVVIDVHTRRLVALQPGDALGALKKSATAEWLCNHLSKMNRRSLYSRVITSESITLKDISQLATRIDDESEKTVDHILTGHQMESEDTIIQSVLSHVNGDDVKRLIVKSWESKRDIISLYTLIKTVDEGLTGKLLPYVKAVTHQCMMMEDDSPYCLLEDRYLECVRMLLQNLIPRSLNDPVWQSAYIKGSCVFDLQLLRQVWSSAEADEWDQIKEFPEAPVSLEQDEHLKELEKAEKALANSTSKCDTLPAQPEPILENDIRLLEAKAFPRFQVQLPFCPGYKLIADCSHKAPNPRTARGSRPPRRADPR